MIVRRWNHPAELLAAVEPLLLKHEAENCFLLGHLASLASPTDALLLSIADDHGTIKTVALMTPSRHMVMTRAERAAVDALTRFLHAGCLHLPGIQSPGDGAERFAERWTQLVARRERSRTRMAVHQLSAVVQPKRPARGQMRVAVAADLELVVSYILGFRSEIGEAHLTDHREIAARRIGNGEFFLWQRDDCVPVAIAGATGTTRSGVRIVLVYTPPEHRGQGYASSLVAALSQHMLDGGRDFCFLFTNVANPTSNKIYRDIGYQFVSESTQILFD